MKLMDILAIIYYSVTTGLAIGGFWYAVVQIREMKKTRGTEYEQLRREKTIEMISYYGDSLTKDTKYIERIVSAFTEEQCRDLYTYTPFTVDRKTRDKICTICPEVKKCESDSEKDDCKTKCKKSDEYCIDGATLLYIREKIMKYLNTLETVLLAWQLGIVEQKVIEEQFAFLNRKSAKERTLEVFRSIAGNGHSYPATERFYQHLKQKENKAAQKELKSILQ